MVAKSMISYCSLTNVIFKVLTATICPIKAAGVIRGKYVGCHLSFWTLTLGWDLTPDLLLTRLTWQAYPPHIEIIWWRDATIYTYRQECGRKELSEMPTFEGHTRRHIKIVNLSKVIWSFIEVSLSGYIYGQWWPVATILI